MKNEQIVAMIPHYGDYGEHQTRVIYENTQEVISNKKLKTYVQKLAEEEWLNMRAQKRAIGKKLFQSNNAPIILYGEPYICVKLRKPRVCGDGAYGYVRAKYISEVRAVEKNSEILLANGVRIPVLTSLTTLRKHVAYGKLL